MSSPAVSRASWSSILFPFWHGICESVQWVTIHSWIFLLRIETGASATLVSPLVGDDKPGGTGPPYSQIYGGPFLWFHKIATVWHDPCLNKGVLMILSTIWHSLFLPKLRAASAAHFLVSGRCNPQKILIAAEDGEFTFSDDDLVQDLLD